MGIPSISYLIILSVPLTLYIARKLPSYLLVAISLVNIYYLISTDYFRFTTAPRPTMSTLNQFTKDILKKSLTNNPKLVLLGPGSKWPSTTMPYQYLIWYNSLSMPPAGTHAQFIISENPLRFRMLE